MLFKDQKREKATLLQIRMKESEKEALKEIADKYNMTLTDLIKEAVNEYIEKLEKNKK